MEDSLQDQAADTSKWELRGIPQGLRDLVRAAAQEQSLTLGAWVRAAIDLKLACDAEAKVEEKDLRFQFRRLKQRMDDMDERFARRVRQVLADDEKARRKKGR